MKAPILALVVPILSLFMFWLTTNVIEPIGTPGEVEIQGYLSGISVLLVGMMWQLERIANK